MAYVLGFFAADGNLTIGKRGNHYIEFTSCDKVILGRIRIALDSDHKISLRKRIGNHKQCFRIQIGSKILFGDLVSFGFTPNKSKKLAYPKIPNEYFRYFVRGYFDGDGHVTTGTYKKSDRNKFIRILFSGFTSGTRSFLERLKDNLMKLQIVKGGTLHYSKGYRLNFSTGDSLRLYEFLYKGIGNGLYLTRKKQVFEKYLNAVVA